MDSFAHDRIAAATRAIFAGPMSKAFEGLQKLHALNLQAAKTWHAEQQVLAFEAARAPSLTALVDLQARQLTATWHKAAAYWRHVCEVAAQTQAECATAAEQGISAYLREASTLIDHIGKAAPAAGIPGFAHPSAPNDGGPPMLPTTGHRRQR